MKRLLQALVLAGAAAIAAFAQVGAISGTVTDASGLAVAGAKVVVANTSTGVARETASNETGAFAVTSLAPGVYRVDVEAPGFRRFSESDIRLQVDERLRVDARLAIGAVTEVVEVKGQASVVNTQDAVLRNVVDSQRMVDLPLNGRNPLQLVELTPGVIPIPDDASVSFQASGQVSVSVSGSRSNGLNYVLDGADNMDTYASRANAYPNPDLLQEFSVQTNAYSAEFGGRAGGVVNAVSKAGTNAFHGTAFEFLRNYSLNARNFFAAGNDGLKRNQYGGTFGGPVAIPGVYDGRGRTFFFGGLQWTATRSTPTTTSTRVLTAAQRQGDYSSVLNAAGNVVAVRDPDTRQPFAGNRIPASRLDPVFQNLLKALPAAAESTGLLRYAKQSNSDHLEGSLRVDHNLNEKNRLYGRFFRKTETTPNTGFEGNILSYGNSWLQVATNAALNYTLLVRPTLLAEFSINFNRSNGVRGEGAPFTWQDLGVDAPSTGVSKDLMLNSVGSYFSIILYGDTRLVRNNYQYKGVLSWMHGRHSVRSGYDIIRRHFNIPVANTGYHGTYAFGGSLAGDNAADALLGRPSSFIQTDGFRVAARETDYVAFFQDDVKLSRRVTMNFGVRFEPFRPWSDTWAAIPQTVRFIPGAQSKVYTKAPAGLLFYGDPGVPRNIMKIANNRISPRMGLAIDPFGDGRTAIRVGYGIFYDTLVGPGQIQIVAGDVKAFTTSTTLSYPVSTAKPYTGKVNPFPAQVPKPFDYVFTTPMTLRTYSPDITNPYIQQWNLTIERRLPGAIGLARASYQGSKGTRLQALSQENPAQYKMDASMTNVERRRPYAPDYGSIVAGRSVGGSSYNAMVLTYEKRFSGSYSVTGSYTWSKSIDTGSNSFSSGTGDVLTHPDDWRADRSVSDGDRPHALMLSYIWDLPRLRKANPILRHLFGGWQNNGIWSKYSGVPVDLATGTNTSLNGVGGDRPNLVGNAYYSGDRSREEQILHWFNPAAFVANPAGTYGTLGRNAIRGPGRWNVDVGLFKKIRVAEGHSVQFRSEFFNIFNHANLGQPNASLNSTLFGRITSASSPRIIQMALKYVF